GVGGFYIFSKSGTPTTADLYINGGIFRDDCVSYSKLIGTPGTTENAITVGSYDWNDQYYSKERLKTVGDPCGNAQLTIGGLSCYSNPGYSRSGVVKPDIVAPGQFYHSSYAKFPNGQGVNSIYSAVDNTGNYRLFNGTSAATPYVAGVVALMMQKKPSITLG